MLEGLEGVCVVLSRFGSVWSGVGLAFLGRERSMVTYRRPRAAVDLDVALKMKAEGKSVRDIAKALGVGVGTVQRALQGVPKGSPDPASGRNRQPLGLQGHGEAA